MLKVKQLSQLIPPSHKSFFLLEDQAAEKERNFLISQCANLIRDFGFVHLSSGDLLRDEMKTGGPDALELKKIMDEGKLVSSEMVVRLI